MHLDFYIDDLPRVAETLAQQLEPGTVVCLEGDMGVGKTTLIRALCSIFKNESHVTSPTFSLVNIYDGSPVIYHMDLYRLSSEIDMLSLDLDRYFLDCDAITFVEWPERLGRFKPVNSVVWSLTALPEKGEHYRSIFY